MMLRHIPLGKMNNLRDLGGYPAEHGRCTGFGRFLRGDNPMGMSAVDTQWLIAHDITTVIDLRSAEELERSPDELSLIPAFRYHHIPLLGGERLPNLEADVGRAYFQILDQQDCVRKVLRVIAHASGGVLYHCTAGKDRTGMISMLLLSLAGVGKADILADYEVSETYLAEIIRQLRMEHPDMPAFWGASKREYMTICMDLLSAKYGSVPGYLVQLGLSDGELHQIRDKLLCGEAKG